MELCPNCREGNCQWCLVNERGFKCWCKCTGQTFAVKYEYRDMDDKIKWQYMTIDVPVPNSDFWITHEIRIFDSYEEAEAVAIEESDRSFFMRDPYGYEIVPKEKIQVARPRKNYSMPAQYPREVWGYSGLPTTNKTTEHHVLRLTSEEVQERNTYIRQRLRERARPADVAAEVGLSYGRVLQIAKSS